MTRAEAEKHVRSGGHRCQGAVPTKPLKITQEDARALRKMGYEVVPGSPGPTTDDVRAAFAAGDQDKAVDVARIGRVLWCMHKVGRPECSYDFNDTVCAGPFDGEPHDYVCPECGCTGTYRAPWFEGLTE